MSDTWSDIQAVKSQSRSYRERMLRRRKEREGLVADLTSGGSGANAAAGVGDKAKAIKDASENLSPRATSISETKESEPVSLDPETLAQIENKLQMILSDLSLDFPIDSVHLCGMISKQFEKTIPRSTIEDMLQKFSAQAVICIIPKDGEEKSGKTVTVLDVTSADHAKLVALYGGGEDGKKRKRDGDSADDPSGGAQKLQKTTDSKKNEVDSVESLLSTHSAKEREQQEVNEEILELLSKPTAKEQNLVEKFRSQGGNQVQEFCHYGTKEECRKVNIPGFICNKLHFKKIINKHTDEMLGDCSFLNTCFHMDTCKYVHYEIDYPEMSIPKALTPYSKKSAAKGEGSYTMIPPQWCQCDLRTIDMTTLQKFAVVMADPPWDIHMELPYGTMSDDEMRKLNVPCLQDEGYIFLWVTGRAMELGRECLKLWGYERIDELIWVKTNQLQRIIRTGRTGHWLNHGKEHCLVGVKGTPKNLNRGLDCDVIVAEVRATSHKPDEIYGIIERLAPGARKIELFGRPHNVQPNWITLGNQVDGVRLIEPEVVKAFKKRYPDGNCMIPAP